MNILQTEFLSFISEAAPEQKVIVHHENDYAVFKFDFLENSEYEIELYLYDDDPTIEAGIVASLKSKSDSESFWYMPFEPQAYNTSDLLLKELKESIILLITHKSRITQKKGAITWKFFCEYQEDNLWKPIYSMCSLRFTVKVPKIAGDEKVYFCIPKTKSIEPSPSL